MSERRRAAAPAAATAARCTAGDGSLSAPSISATSAGVPRAIERSAARSSATSSGLSFVAFRSSASAPSLPVVA